MGRLSRAGTGAAAFARGPRRTRAHLSGRSQHQRPLPQLRTEIPAMPDFTQLVRIPSLKNVSDFRNYVTSLEINLPCEDTIQTGATSPLAQPVEPRINGKRIGNRFAVQPMEGWDG